MKLIYNRYLEQNILMFRYLTSILMIKGIMSIHIMLILLECHFFMQASMYAVAQDADTENVQDFRLASLSSDTGIECANKPIVAQATFDNYNNIVDQIKYQHRTQNSINRTVRATINYNNNYLKSSCAPFIVQPYLIKYSGVKANGHSPNTICK